MASKLLQGLGVLALLGLIGASFGALFAVKQKVHVTIAEEDAAAQRGPDPVELLRADVGALAGDLQALSGGVGEGLQTLHDTLEAAAAERDQAARDELGELRAEVAALQARLERALAEVLAEEQGSRARLDAALARVQRTVEELGAGGAAPLAGAPPGPQATPELAASLASAEPAPVELGSAPSEPREEPAPQVLESAPAKKTFLSFKLPSASFAFDRPQRLAIVPSLSRVGFDARSTLHDFSGVTSKVAGELATTLARPEAGCQGEIRVEAGSLVTGLEDRDAEMWKTLDVERSPTLSFRVTAFEPETVDPVALTLTGTVRGSLTIRGTTRDLALPVRVSVDASKRVVIEGETLLKMGDFGVVPPSKLGVVKVEDELKIWIALRARSLGAAEEAGGD